MNKKELLRELVAQDFNKLSKSQAILMCKRLAVLAQSLVLDDLNNTVVTDIWKEVHYEMVQAMTERMAQDVDNRVNTIFVLSGHPILYTLSEELTDEFIKLHEGKVWKEYEFEQAIEVFTKEKLDF